QVPTFWSPSAYLRRGGRDSRGPLLHGIKRTDFAAARAESTAVLLRRTPDHPFATRCERGSSLGLTSAAKGRFRRSQKGKAEKRAGVSPRACPLDPRQARSHRNTPAPSSRESRAAPKTCGSRSTPASRLSPA